MTTPVWIEGWEHGALSTSGAGLVNVITGSPTVQSTIKRTGAYALQCTSTGSSVYITKNISSQTLVWRSYVYFSALPASGNNYLVAGYASGATYPVFYYGGTSNSFFVGLNGVAGSQQSSMTLVTDHWYQIDLRFNTTANTITIDWSIDGTEQTSFSGSGTAFTMTGIRLGLIGTAAGTVVHDDCVVSYTTADYPIGPGGIDALRPNGSTLTGNMTGSYTDVDDSLWTSTTDYISQTVADTSHVALDFENTARTTIHGAMGYLTYKSSGTTANNGSTTIGSTTIYSGDMSESSLFYKSVIISENTQTALNNITGDVGNSSSVATTPQWHALMIQVAWGESNEVSGDANLTLGAVELSAIATSVISGISSTTLDVVGISASGTAETINHEIVHVDHETGDKTQYTGGVLNDGAHFNVTQAAALGETDWGLAVTIADTTAHAGYVNYGSARDYSFIGLRIYFDPNSLSMIAGNVFRFIYTQETTGYLIYAEVRLEYSNGYVLRFIACNDVGATVFEDTLAISDAPHCIEYLITRASTDVSSDGSVEWWVDDLSQGSYSGIDNYSLMTGKAQRSAVGAYSFSGGTPSGTIYLDELVVRDDNTHIGSLDLGSLGTLNSTLNNISGTLTAIVEVKGTSAITLTDLAKTLTGAVEVKGMASITLAALTKTLTGVIEIKGTSAITLTDLTKILTGVAEAKGILSVGLSDITGTLTGTVETVVLLTLTATQIGSAIRLEWSQ